MKRTLVAAVLAGSLLACDDDGGETLADGGLADAAVVEDGGAQPDRFVPPDDEPPLTLDAVSGDLTYADLSGEGFLVSVFASGQLRQRITTAPGRWTHHAVGPDPRYLVAVRENDEGRGEVWIVDVQLRDEYAITPAECDAGIGGVGWRDELRVMFAMRCGDEPAAAYLASRDLRDRDRDNLLQVSDHPEPVRDVFPAVKTSFYLYVLDVEQCDGGCLTKPEVWLADADTGARCRVSDGAPAVRDVRTISGDGELRLGDHNPSFNRALTSALFSRNVAGKPAGPTGHHDMMRVGLNLRGLGTEEGTACAQDGSEVNLSEALLRSETYPNAAGEPVVGHERTPRAPAGRAPGNNLLYTGVTHAPGGRTGVVFVVDISGNATALTPGDGNAGYASWIVEQYDTSGDR